MSGSARCVRCGELYLAYIAKGIDECDECGEIAVMDNEAISDLLNEIYTQTNDGLDFNEWVIKINREELFDAD